jgi:hypothetical protein
MRKSLAFAGLLVCAMSGAAFADDDSGCAKFKWSIAKERALFAAPTPVGAGAVLEVGAAAYRVALADNDEVAYPARPERASKAGTHGAVLTFAVKDDGLYDVTLSDEGWIDVVDHGQRISSSDFSGQKACPGVRKSVRFSLKAGDFTLQLSNVEGKAINIAVVPAP